jgi:FKBP-type peptidyl-prolyl cis-trans isomerase 2
MVIKQGDTVKVDYTGTLENGNVFDTSKGKQPLEFEVGAGKMIPGFDKAVIGMEKGQEKEISIKPEEAYGEPREELKKEIPRSALPQDQEPKVGMGLMMNTPQGQQFPARIIKVTDENITIDLNHPLAGKTLNFKIKIADIVSK